MKNLIIILSIALWLFGCGKKSTTVESVDLVGQYHTYAGAPNIPLEVGATEQFQIIANYSDDHWEDKSTDAIWSTNMVCPSASDSGSSGNAIATVSVTGLVTGISGGTVYIVAVYSGYQACFQLTVNGAALVSIEVTPANATIDQATTEQYTATGTYADATTRDITSSVTWSTNNSAIASISNDIATKGLATGVSPGSVLVIATLGSISGNTTLTVTAPTLVSIAVTPANPSVALGLTQQFTATGTYSNSTTQDITTSVTWSSSDLAKATINASGLASTVATGNTTITATLGAVSGNTTLTVAAAALVSISVTPNPTSFRVGLTKQFTATGTYTDSSTANITTSVTWTTSSNSIATISNTAGTEGLATGVAIGFVTIRAASGSIQGSASATIAP